MSKPITVKIQGQKRVKGKWKFVTLKGVRSLKPEHLVYSVSAVLEAQNNYSQGVIAFARQAGVASFKLLVQTKPGAVILKADGATVSVWQTNDKGALTISSLPVSFPKMETVSLIEIYGAPEEDPKSTLILRAKLLP